MNRIFTYCASALITVVSAFQGSQAKGEDEIPFFRASHGYDLGLSEMIDLTKIEGFDKVRSIGDLAEFASKVPDAVGFTAHPSFENGEHRLAHAVLWYSHLSPSNMSWGLYLFEEKEAKKQPGEAATEAALAAAEAQVSAKLEIAQERIDGGGKNGVVLLGDRHEKEIIARAVLRLGGSFQHTGTFGSGCICCRSVVRGGTPSQCGVGIQDKMHWNCCGSLEKASFCDYWESLLAREQEANKPQQGKPQ